MHGFLAYAESVDSSGAELLTVLIGMGAAAVACGMAFVPIRLAKLRRHRHREGIIAAMILWALLVAGSVIYVAVVQLNWSQERLLRIESGYYDPTTTGDAPTKPWAFWAGAIIVYAGLVAWSTRGEKPAASPKD